MYRYLDIELSEYTEISSRSEKIVMFKIILIVTNRITIFFFMEIVNKSSINI